MIDILKMYSVSLFPCVMLLPCTLLQFTGSLVYCLVCVCVCFLQQLNVSSIAPCEESETQLYIANSIEVRSDEICADSVYSVNDGVPASEVVKADRNVQSHVVVSRQVTAGGIHSRLRSKTNGDFSSKLKSSCVAPSRDAIHSDHKSLPTSHRSDAAADAGDKHCTPVQKNDYHLVAVDNVSAGCPVIQNGIMKLSSQVWLHKFFTFLNVSLVQCNNVIATKLCCVL